MDNSVYISKDDALKLHCGDQIRLIELYNIQIVDIKTEARRLTIIGKWSGDEVKPDVAKFQWVAKNDAHPFEIFVPRELYIGDRYNDKSLEVWKGFCESYVTTLKPGSMVQFVRMGFCRIEGVNSAIYSHR